MTRGASGRRAIAGHRGGEGQVVEAELAATPNKLDEMIAGLTGPRTEVDDPDGLVRFTLSDDERLLSLFIDDAVHTSLNNLGLDKKRDDRFAAGNEAMRLFARCSRNPHGH